jgi:hypothetical protein
MWQQFVKFTENKTTVAVSFEDTQMLTFPTFAFCDARAYKRRMPFPGTAKYYNESAFDIASEVTLEGVGSTDYNISNYVNHSVIVEPTSFNGYCKVILSDQGCVHQFVRMILNSDS